MKDSPMSAVNAEAVLTISAHKPKTLRCLLSLCLCLSESRCAETWTNLLCLLPRYINPLNPELYPICYLLALLGAHHFLHVSRIRVKSLTFRLLMSYIYIYIYIYIYGAPILDVSRSHTKTQHSR